MSNRTISKRAAKGCPICGAVIAPAHTPFCSQGCRDRDLLRWLDEGYRAPGRPANSDGQEIDFDGLDSEA